MYHAPDFENTGNSPDSSDHCPPSLPPIVEITLRYTKSLYSPCSGVGSEPIRTAVYFESLSIDRASQTVQLTQEIGPDCTVTCRYEVKEAVGVMLDYFDEIELFCPQYPTGKDCMEFPCHNEELVEYPDHTAVYILHIYREDGSDQLFSGSYDNWFVDGMGCAIRSEIWACLAPGDPERAAKFAYEDACVDHAGDGMWAEVFLAAMESAAFVESDVRKIIEIGKAQIPAESKLRIGIEDAIRWFDEKPEFDYLFRMIMGLEQPTSGSFRVGETVKIAYVDQQHKSIDPEKSVYEVISQNSDIITLGNRSVNARAYVARFNFSGADQEKKCGMLSGGERNRLHLALALKEEGNVLLLDEPTNDIDVNTLRALEEGLENFAGCAVVISHDRWFLDRIATHILSFEGDSKVVFFEGSYSEYEEHKRAMGEDTTPHRVKYRKLME